MSRCFAVLCWCHSADVKKKSAFYFWYVVTILTSCILSYGVYALTTMPVVFFSAKFHWQSQKNRGRITFASHMSLKSVLGVSFLPQEQTKKKAFLVFSSLFWEIFVNIQQASTSQVREQPCS